MKYAYQIELEQKEEKKRLEAEAYDTYYNTHKEFIEAIGANLEKTATADPTVRQHKELLTGQASEMIEFLHRHFQKFGYQTTYDKRYLTISWK